MQNEFQLITIVNRNVDLSILLDGKVHHKKTALDDGTSTPRASHFTFQHFGIKLPGYVILHMPPSVKTNLLL